MSTVTESKIVTDDRRIVTLHHGYRNPDPYSAFYRSQCADLDERLVYDVTSRNPDRQFARGVSPMYMGPVITGDGLDAECFEVYWQACKLYPCHAMVGEPTEDYWKYRQSLFRSEIDSLNNMVKRYPNRELGCETRACICSIWYNKKTGKYEKLGYVASRKKSYIPEYAKLVYKTEAFLEIKKAYDSGRKIALIDFDVYNYYKEGKTIFDVINDGRRAAGHGYVIKMLLEGDIEVVDGEVIDHIGILNPINDSEKNVPEVTATPSVCGFDFSSNAIAQSDNKSPITGSDKEEKSFERVTPERIDSLENGQIFVFGSDVQGLHRSGAAKMAEEKFGAVRGVGNGLSGQSYAIPMPYGNPDAVKRYVDEFISFAREHPDMNFLVTKIGCGVAGYKVEKIAPMFVDASALENVWLPAEFRKILNA